MTANTIRPTESFSFPALAEAAAKRPTNRVNAYLQEHGRMSAADIADDVLDGDMGLLIDIAEHESTRDGGARWGVADTVHGGSGTWYGSWQA
ncbi:hypothetical protein LCGC14_0259010 [marine sediment metagenome]|uniref:Uncharacterized protein n=1 Tax=marine sediment metagenome TaxID=412755 RepID=A0A0F9WMV0_9ZZZZ